MIHFYQFSKHYAVCAGIYEEWDLRSIGKWSSFFVFALWIFHGIVPPRLKYSLLFQELPNGIGPAHNGPPMPHPHPPHIPHTSTSGPLPPMMGSNGPLPPMNGMMGPLPPMSVAGPMGPGPSNGGPLPPMSSGSLPPMVSWIKLPEKTSEFFLHISFLMVDGVYVNMKLGAKNLAGFLTFLTVWHFSVREGSLLFLAVSACH